jgi:threonine aldolase
MRAAMAAAEVGDDVLDGDPTMRELEERVAGLLGTADAMWTPSGSMGNLIALMHHLERGDTFLAPEGAHVLSGEPPEQQARTTRCAPRSCAWRTPTTRPAER